MHRAIVASKQSSLQAARYACSFQRLLPGELGSSCCHILYCRCTRCVLDCYVLETAQEFAVSLAANCTKRCTKPLPVNSAHTGSVHRHHVATGQRSLDLSRVATSKLLSKASAPPGNKPPGRASAHCRRELRSPRQPFRSWHVALVTSQSAKRVATALPRRCRGVLPSPVWTFAQNTAPALAGVLLRPHSQSSGQSA